MRILLIDDTPEIAELLSFALHDHGYDVAAVGFDPSVCDLVAEHQPDAVVLDCTSFDMAEMLFDALRASTDYTALPIVIVSDTPEQADASLRRREAEHVLLIPKPFTGGHVARALSQLLNQSEVVHQPPLTNPPNP
jgi:DNA-binding response OmpR family regulator